MFSIKICDMFIGIDCIYKETENFCRDYIVTDQSPDLTVTSTPEDIENEIALYPEYPPQYHELIVIFRKLTEALLPYGIFFLHSAIVEKDGKGYIFTGKSGAGKSTHAGLWEKYIPGATIINGDKPFIKKEDDRFFAYGNPWAGKEGKHADKKAKISAVCFIKQGTENIISELNSAFIISKIFDQVSYPKTRENTDLLLKLLDSFISTLPFYELECDISEDAVKVAHEKMVKEAL